MKIYYNAVREDTDAGPIKAVFMAAGLWFMITFVWRWKCREGHDWGPIAGRLGGYERLEMCSKCGRVRGEWKLKSV